jgi:hypothetical protein
MNTEMAYLIGMICGNGEIKRASTTTTISIEIPHKKLKTENLDDVRIYIKASITDIRSILVPLIGVDLQFIPQTSCDVLSFTKPNDDYLIREILRHVGNGTSHENMRVDQSIFAATFDERKSFLQGFADVTGYIRRSNYYFEKYKHRVYIEIPRNWWLVIDICNLLKSVDIPVQTIDWAHPNIRDGKLTKLHEGKKNFWKKEHQIKIWANEFETIGFGVLHKKEALSQFAKELIAGFECEGQNPLAITHKYYWEARKTERKNRPSHSSESDDFIPQQIRGRHYNTWHEIAKDLGYGES